MFSAKTSVHVEFVGLESWNCEAGSGVAAGANLKAGERGGLCLHTLEGPASAGGQAPEVVTKPGCRMCRCLFFFFKLL